MRAFLAFMVGAPEASELTELTTPPRVYGVAGTVWQQPKKRPSRFPETARATTRVRLFADDLSLFNHHRHDRHVLVKALGHGGHGLDGVDHFLALHHLAEHGIAPALGIFGGVIQEGVVGHVDEKLGRGRMGLAGAGHGDGIGLVLEAVVGFVGDGGVGGLFLEVFVHAAALDHEAVDHAVEHRAVIMAGLDVGQKVFNRDRRLFLIQLQDDLALAGRQLYHGFSSPSPGDADASQGYGQNQAQRRQRPQHESPARCRHQGFLRSATPGARREAVRAALKKNRRPVASLGQTRHDRNNSHRQHGQVS